MKAVVRHLSSQAPVAAASPEHSSSATSGTYFRAVRGDEEDVAAVLAEEERRARVESLLESGLWRIDLELVASRMVDLAARKLDPR